MQKKQGFDVYFLFIGLMMAVAAGLQIYAGSEVGRECDDKLARAPTNAGITLLCSFIANGFWVYAKRNNMTMLARGSILVWTILVVVGTAAAGAALGQAELFGDVGCEVEVSETLHYASIVLLVLSISLPHARQKRHAHVVYLTTATDAADDASPEQGAPSTGTQQPLQFL